MRLKDKVAIITGSAGGLGRAYALGFSREGAKVVVCDVIDCADTAGEITAQKGEVLAIKTDVTSEADTLTMAKKTYERFGRIDILVNNAAIYAGLVQKPFYQITENEWDKLMAVNLKGMFFCCKAVFPYMKAQGKGKIVNIASETVFSGAPNMLHYVTSKGGVVAFTRALARELGNYNINVNTMAPGLTMTQASLDLVAQERIDMNASARCLKRREQPEDPVGAALFLSSAESDFITGQVIVVNGGYVLH